MRSRPQSQRINNADKTLNKEIQLDRYDFLFHSHITAIQQFIHGPNYLYTRSQAGKLVDSKNLQ